VFLDEHRYKSEKRLLDKRFGDVDLFALQIDLRQGGFVLKKTIDEFELGMEDIPAGFQDRKALFDLGFALFAKVLVKISDPASYIHCPDAVKLLRQCLVDVFRNDDHRGLIRLTPTGF